MVTNRAGYGMPGAPMPRRHIAHTLRMTAGSVLLLLAAGCQHPFPRPYEIPKGAMPEPLGTATYSRMDAQHGIAQQANYVLFAHHWYQGGELLGPDGQSRLNQIARELATNPVWTPVVIEAQPIIVRSDPKVAPASSDEAYLATLAAAQHMNETRRTMVVRHLQEAGIEDAEQRVVVGEVPQGLYGAEAPLAYQQLLWGNMGTMGGRGMGMGGRGMMGRGMGGGWGGLGGGFGGGMGGFGRGMGMGVGGGMF